MKIGICCGFDQAKTVLDMGYDYFEGSLTALEAMGEDQFRALRDSGVRAYACNGMIPANYPLTGPARDLPAALGYCERAARRAAELGVQVVVFGSAGARNLPEGTGYAGAWRDLAEYAAGAGEIFGHYGIRIAVEPLSKKESNILHYVVEGLELARMSQSRNVGGLADLYHMVCNGEGMDGIRAAGPKLWHCHIANAEGRVFPRVGDGQETVYAAFFGALKGIGYQGGVSVEAGCTDFLSDAPAALKCLRAYAE